MIMNSLGKSYMVLGDTEKEINYFKNALEINEKLYNYPHPDVAQCLHDVGKGYHDYGDVQKAIEYYQKTD